MKFNAFAFACLCLLIACSPNNVEDDNTAQKFLAQKNFTGSFALLNNANNSFKIYNLADFKDSAYVPGSSFDLINALIAIESGSLTDENSNLRIDGQSISLKNAWDGESAFFDTLAVKTGAEKMRFWLDSLHYGRANIPDAQHTLFWKNGFTKITADEQLGIIKKLHFSQFPFQKRTQAIVENLLKRESNTLYNLYYNQGMARQTSGEFACFINGYIIENKHVYFFSLTTKSDKAENLLSETKEVLKNILKEYGFFEGKK